MTGSAEDEIRKDVNEAKTLLEKASRPALRDLLSKYIEDNERLIRDDAAAPKNTDEVEQELLEAAPMVKSSVTAPPPPKISEKISTHAPEMKWVAPSYGWEQGEYNSSWVTVFVNIENVGQVKDQVKCDFGTDSFDLRAIGVPSNGATINYRLLIEVLDKDIVPKESEIIVKKNRVKLKLKKIKGEYSYEQWVDLKKKGGRAAKQKDKDKDKDPSQSIMDLMKDMYESGDDKTRKIIAESMMKSRRGEAPDAPSPSFGGADDDLGGLGDGALPKF